VSSARFGSSLRAGGDAAILGLLLVALAGCSPALPSGSDPATQVLSTAPLAPSPTVPASSGSPQASTPRGHAFTVVRSALKLPAGRSRAAAIVEGSTILVCGGLTSAGGTTGSILRIDLETGRVSALGTLAVAVHDAGAAVLGNAGFVFGGGRTVAGQRVQRIDAAGRVTRIGELPAPRADLAAIAVAGEVLIVGGGTPARPDPRILASTDGIHFREVARLIVAVRYPAVAVLDGIVYVAGGSTPSGETGAIQAIDPATGVVRLVGHLPHPIADATALLVGGELVLAGGRDRGRVLDELWLIGSGGRSVSNAGHLPYAVADAAGVTIGGVGYVIGGETNGPISSILTITAP
jgi:hypothetical protein